MTQVFQSAAATDTAIDISVNVFIHESLLGPHYTYLLISQKHTTTNAAPFVF